MGLASIRLPTTRLHCLIAPVEPDGGQPHPYWKKGSFMFFLRFLHDKIPPGDQVMHDFVEHLLPNLFALYADTSAKGGDQSGNRTVN